MTSPPPLTLGAVNIRSDAPERLARFWAEATGGTVTGSHEGSVYVSPAPGGVAFFLQHEPGHRVTSTDVHLDLTAPPGRRQAEVDRLVVLGATWRWDVIGEVPWVDWTTLADPESNLFCVASHHD